MQDSEPLNDGDRVDWRGRAGRIIAVYPGNFCYVRLDSGTLVAVVATELQPIRETNPPAPPATPEKGLAAGED